MQILWKLRRHFLVAALCLMTMGSANAIFVTHSYYFSGTCTDCTGTVTAELTLSGFVDSSDVISQANFRSFSYHGSDLLNAYNVTKNGNNGNLATTEFTLDTVSGNLPSSFPGPTDFSVSFHNLNTSGYFGTSQNGNWYTCASGNCLDDFGTKGTFSSSAAAVPEPGTLLLVGASLGALSLTRRRRAA